MISSKMRPGPRLLANAEKIDLGEAIRITAEVKDEALQPWIEESFEVIVERDGEAPEHIHLLPVESVPGAYELQLRPTQLGAYRALSA